MDLATRDNIRVIAIAATMIAVGVLGGEMLASLLDLSSTGHGVLIVAGYVLGGLTTAAIVGWIDRRREALTDL